MNKPIKVVYNDCYGGFSLSEIAKELYKKISGKEISWDIERHDPILCEVVETLGEKANGNYAELKIITLKGNRYRIHEYDGAESVKEPKDINWIEVKK